MRCSQARRRAVEAYRAAAHRTQRESSQHLFDRKSLWATLFLRFEAFDSAARCGGWESRAAGTASVTARSSFSLAGVITPVRPSARHLAGITGTNGRDRAFNREKALCPAPQALDWSASYS